MSKSSLNEIKKDVKWLLKKLNIQNKKELKNIIIVSYDESIDKISITYKTAN